VEADRSAGRVLAEIARRAEDRGEDARLAGVEPRDGHADIPIQTRPHVGRLDLECLVQRSPQDRGRADPDEGAQRHDRRREHGSVPQCQPGSDGERWTSHPGIRRT